MAERRMFAKTIIDSDAFIDMPMSTRLLYYDLGMRADDDGFVNSPKKILKMTGCTDDDMNMLIAKKFIIPFDSGIVVIKHWRINNYLRHDRYRETTYTTEKSMLEVDENGAYSQLGIPTGIPVVAVGKDRIGKDRIGKDRIGKDRYMGVPEELIEPMKAFEEMRKAAKSPLTDRAFKMILTKANELSGGDMKIAAAIINQSAMSGWKGVYPLKDDTAAKTESMSERLERISNE